MKERTIASQPAVTLYGHEYVFPLKTQQEVFDYVCARLVLQGGPSKRNGFCVFFGEDNRRCARGWLMLKEQEGTSMNHTDSSIVELDLECREEYEMALQRLHDHASLRWLWNRGLSWTDALRIGAVDLVSRYHLAESSYNPLWSAILNNQQET
jgi:hypothetical protein